MAPTRGSNKRSLDEMLGIIKSTVKPQKVAAYDPKLEPAPRAVTTSSEWKTLEDCKRSIHNALTAPFKAVKSEYSTDITTAMVELIDDCLLNDTSAPIIIKVSGAMGVGKSLLLNCLFQCAGQIARSADDSDSCTLASNKFQSAKKGQKTRFLAVLKFWETELQHSILSSFVRDHYRATNGADENDPDEAPHSAEDQEDLSKVSDEVETALVALFKDDPKFSTKADVRDFLDKANSEDDPSILQQLFAMCSNLIKGATGGAQTVTVGASTTGELLAKLTEFITQPYTGDGGVSRSLWPMVCLVTYHFDDPILEHGVVFLDTPGLSDESRTRQLSASKYDREKTHAIVVTNTIRARADHSIQSEVKSMHSRGEGKTIVVVTRNEEIEDGSGAGRDDAEKKKAAKLKDEFLFAKSKLAELEEEINECNEQEDDNDDDGDDSDNVRLLRDLNKAKSRYEVVLKNAENLEKKCRIDIRSSQTEILLRAKFGVAQQWPTQIPVISTANKVYASLLKEHAPKNAPVFKAEETNIPKVRKWVRTAPNEARLNEAQHMQHVSLPALFSQLRLYTSRTPIERKTDLEAHILAPLKKYPNAIKAVFKKCEKDVLKIALHSFADGGLSWNKQAERLCKDWEDKNKTTPFLALMKQSGHRKSRGNNCAVDMSASLLLIGAPEIAASIARCIQTIICFENTMLSKIEAIFDEMITGITEDSSSSFVSLEPFLDFLHKQKWQLDARIKTSGQRLQDNVEDIRRKATVASEDAYFVVAMTPIYKHICTLKPAPRGAPKVEKPKGGWPALRKALFRDSVTSPNGPWASVDKGMAEDIKKVMKEETKKLSGNIRSIFDGFRTAFNNMCESKNVDSPIGVKLQEQLAAILDKVEEIQSGRMQEAYNKLYADFH